MCVLSVVGTLVGVEVRFRKYLYFAATHIYICIVHATDTTFFYPTFCIVGKFGEREKIKKERK